MQLPKSLSADGQVTTGTVDGYATTRVAISEGGRAIAMVFAGFGDGPALAAKIVASYNAHDGLSQRLRDIVQAYEVGSASALEVWINDTRALLAKAGV